MSGKITINTDGGSRGNPGHAAIGIIAHDDEKVIYQVGEYLGVLTNNEAEYKAVVKSLEWILDSNLSPSRPISFLLDSKLVVEQLNKRWKIKDDRMRVLANDCFKLLEKISNSVTFSHVPREKNSQADALVNQALDARLA